MLEVAAHRSGGVRMRGRQYCDRPMRRVTRWKSPDAGRGRGQEEKGTTEGEMAGWHHRPDGHGFE